MINPFVMRKYAALILSSMLTVMFFYVGLVMYGFWFSLAFLGGGLLIVLVVANLLLKNPFTSMLEGKGILVLDINSTGIIKPFIVSVQNPYVFGKVGGRFVKDVFDRSAVMQLAVPKVNSSPLKKKGGGVRLELDENEMIALKTKTLMGKTVIELSEKDYNDGRFALFHYPVLIWNDQIKSILTKDFLAEGEKEAFAEHGILYLNRKMEELTSVVRDFGRYVVELTKPKGSLFQNKWVWIVLGVGLVILALLFAPSIISTVQGSMGGATSAFKTAAGNAGSITLQ